MPTISFGKQIIRTNSTGDLVDEKGRYIANPYAVSSPPPVKEHIVRFGSRHFTLDDKGQILKDSAPPKSVKVTKEGDWSSKGYKWLSAFSGICSVMNAVTTTQQLSFGHNAMAGLSAIAAVVSGCFCAINYLSYEEAKRQEEKDAQRKQALSTTESFPIRPAAIRETPAARPPMSRVA